MTNPLVARLSALGLPLGAVEQIGTLSRGRPLAFRWAVVTVVGGVSCLAAVSGQSTRAEAKASVIIEERGIRLEIPELSWTATGPTAEILVGAGEQPVRIVPQGTAVASPVEVVRTPLGRSERRSWTWRDPITGNSIGWTVGRLLDRPGFTAQASFHNGGTDPVRLRRLITLDGSNDALQVKGDPAAWWLASASDNGRVGNLAAELPSMDDVTRKINAAFNLPMPAQLGIDERKADGKWRTYRDWLTLFTEEGRRGLAVGAVGDPLADLDIGCRVDNGRVRVVISSEMTEVRVDPGETRLGQELAVLCGDYAGTMEALFRAVAQSHGARTHRGPASGWCSWYHTGLGVSADDIIGIARVTDQERLPLPVIQIDDGWQNGYGDWRRNGRFPGSWKPCIQAIQAAKSVPGIWVAPLRIQSASEVFHKHPDWCQRNAAGRWEGDVDGKPPKERWLDPSHPGTQAWIDGLISGLRAEGFRYFKIDFNRVAEETRFHDPKLTRFQVLRDLYARYRRLVGEESYLLACLGMQRAVCGYADATRTGPDAVSMWRADHPCNIEDCIRGVASSAVANGILWANDPDVAYTRHRAGMSEVENRTWLGHVALLGGSVLTSDPFNTRNVEVGTVTLLRRAADLVVAAEVRDDKPGVDIQAPWSGSSVELFTTSKAGVLHQYFLMPALGDTPAGARIIVGGSGLGLQPATNVTLHSENMHGGWRMRATLHNVADHPGFAAEAKLNSQRATGGPGTPVSHMELVIFGAVTPFASTNGYSPLADGGKLSGAAKFQGYAGTEDIFARMVPPAPEKASYWRGGWDREGSQLGFLARRPWGSFGVVQMHNPADEPAERTLLADGLEGLGAKVHAWSFWDERYLGLVSPEDIKCKLAAGCTR